MDGDWQKVGKTGCMIDADDSHRESETTSTTSTRPSASQ
jgi:hypothetical protein